MNRTFHQKFSIQTLAAVVLLAAMGLWCFLVRTGLTPVAGLVCMLVGAAAVDRLVNTTYVFTPDGMLTITRGRLGRPLKISVDEIVMARKMRGSIFTAPHIVIEYGGNHRMTFAQPTDFDAFIAEIKRRQTTYDNE